MKYIIDTSVIIAFCAECNRSDLLESLVKKKNEIYIPVGVLNEIKPNDISFKKFHILLDKKIINKINTLDEKTIDDFNKKHPYLNKGEIEVILWGCKSSNLGEEYFCVIDDGKARKVAKMYNVVLMGTIGLLGKMTELSIITSEEKNKMISELKKSGFRIKIPP